MAYNVKVAGAFYSDVPALNVQTFTTNPQVLTAKSFYATNDADVTASDIVAGKVAYGSSGSVTGEITARDSTDLSASGGTVTVPAGYYASQASKSVGTGSVRPAASITGTSATATADGTTLTLSQSVLNSPQLTPGYVGFATGATTAVSLSATDSNFDAANIKNGVSIFGKTGTYTGGGTSTLVTGTFTPSTKGAVETVNISYSGSGFPIMCSIFPAAGSYKSDSAIYSLVQRYVIVEWFMTKASTVATPTYTTSGGVNYGCNAWVYKNSTSDATSYTRSSAMTTNTYSSSDPTAAGATAVRFTGNKVMKYMCANTSYGLAKDVEYRYVIMYSA